MSIVVPATGERELLEPRHHPPPCVVRVWSDEPLADSPQDSRGRPSGPAAAHDSSCAVALEHLAERLTELQRAYRLHRHFLTLVTALCQGTSLWPVQRCDCRHCVQCPVIRAHWSPRAWRRLCRAGSSLPTRNQPLPPPGPASGGLTRRYTTPWPMEELDICQCPLGLPVLECCPVVAPPCRSGSRRGRKLDQTERRMRCVNYSCGLLSWGWPIGVSAAQRP